jgi:hypothetical protein
MRKETPRRAGPGAEPTKQDSEITDQAAGLRQTPPAAMLLPSRFGDRSWWAVVEEVAALRSGMPFALQHSHGRTHGS